MLYSAEIIFERAWNKLAAGFGSAKSINALAFLPRSVDGKDLSVE
jgi:hypothetical protein